MIPTIRRLLDAMYPDAPDTLANHGTPLLPAGHPFPDDLGFVAATTGAVKAAPAVDAVMSSTCVDHCAVDGGGLAATVLADLVHGAAVARRLGVPLLSLVGIGQEVRLVPGGGDFAAAWQRVVDMVAVVFAGFDLPAGSCLASTDDADVWRRLEEIVDGDRAGLPDSSLDGLYHPGDDSSFPRGTPFGHYYDYYRYNVACYRRSLVEFLLGRPSRGVLVVENVQQIKAVAVARRLSGDWPVEHLVTLPAPSRTGRDRATRADGDERVLLADLLAGPDPIPGTVNCDSETYWQVVRRYRAELRREGATP